MAKTKIKEISHITTDELKSTLKEMIVSNRELQKKGFMPLSLNIEGESGLGKTSVVLQVAKELDLQCVKLNLSQIEEIGDLVGFPHKEFEMHRASDGKTEWVAETAIQVYLVNRFTLTGRKRMSHAVPKWIEGIETGGILLIDDYTRADSRFMQCMMELIDRQQYISWKLPEDWHIVLTTNPDNGIYNVSSLDPAQKTRFFTVNVKFNIQCWAKWAEEVGIDDRCINFLMLNPEIVNETVNSRSITNFFNAISHISDFSKSIPYIQMLGEGGPGADFTNLFTGFVHNRLDQLVTIEELFKNQNTKEVVEKMNKSIGEDDAYRADIASIYTHRIVNYLTNSTNKVRLTKNMIVRVADIIKQSNLSVDLKYVMIKLLTSHEITKFKELLDDEEVLKLSTK